MATLVRPWIVEYRDKSGRRVKKGTPGVKKVRYRAAKFYGQGLPNLPPRKRVSLATDKWVVEKMLSDLIERGERGIIGLPARDEASRLLTPLITEFEEAVSQKAGAKHVRAVIDHVNQVFDGCRVRTLSDLHAPDLAPGSRSSCGP